MASREVQLMQVSSISLADRTAILARERSNYQYCADYSHENPFDELPANDDYKKRAFWQDLAYQGGEPLALADHALQVLQSIQNVIGGSTDQEKAALQQAQHDINRASQNLRPETVYELSAIFMAPEFQSMPNQFSILLLASCNLGYDCTANNPQLGPIFECTFSGSCSSGYTIDDFVKSYLGPNASTFSSVYAQADLLATAIRQGDTATVSNFLTLKK